MKNSTEKTKVVSGVSINTNSNESKVIKGKPFYDIERRYLNFKTQLHNGLIDSIEMGNYFKQDNFSIIHYFNNSESRKRNILDFTSLDEFNNFLKQVYLNNSSEELYLTWSGKKKIPVLVSY